MESNEQKIFTGWDCVTIMSKGPPPKCKECDDVYLTNPKSKKEGVCRECKKDVGMSRPGKGFSYQ